MLSSAFRLVFVKREKFGTTRASQEGSKRWCGGDDRISIFGNLQQTFFLLLLAGQAMLSPGHRLEPLLLDFVLATGAKAVGALAHAGKRVLDELEGDAIRVRLAEQELLGVGVRRFIGQVYGRILVRPPSRFLGPGDGLPQLVPAGLQLLFVVFEALFFHSRSYGQAKHCPQKPIAYRHALGLSNRTARWYWTGLLLRPAEVQMHETE